MTPAGLLTAIGATAIGFAIAIGSVAGFTSDATTSSPESTSQVFRATALIDTGTNVASRTSAEDLMQSVSGKHDCAIAL